ncbi:hypothetical protein AB0F81_00875 [Actinoplanes sp. NPDC024001]|uniref:hypothetical protein n=1 Tax=Actinoplanes sp. NPDC024001 TaxID=3154598 RepID=UPI0033F411BD
MRRRRGMIDRKVVIGLVVAALAGGALAVGTGLGNASTTCDGLDQAIQRNLDFMAEQRANPNAQTEAVLKNRQDVIDLINVQRQQAGCTGEVAAPPAPPAQEQEAAPEEEAPQQNGDVVCQGSTVTLSGEAGEPFASSGTFPIGTVLKVTNLDNDKSITVTVQTTSGSCILLNNAAFEQVREPGKFLIRRAVIERVG